MFFVLRCNCNLFLSLLYLTATCISRQTPVPLCFHRDLSTDNIAANALRLHAQDQRHRVLRTKTSLEESPQFGKTAACCACRNPNQVAEVASLVEWLLKSQIAVLIANIVKMFNCLRNECDNNPYVSGAITVYQVASFFASFF